MHVFMVDVHVHVCVHKFVVEHKNRHILRYRHLWQKTGFSMLQIEGYNPNSSCATPTI